MNSQSPDLRSDRPDDRFDQLLLARAAGESEAEQRQAVRNRSEQVRRKAHQLREVHQRARERHRALLEELKQQFPNRRDWEGDEP